MARKLIVEIIGDASGLNKSFAEAGVASEKFGAKTTKLSGTLTGLAGGVLKAFAPVVATLGAAEFAKGAIEGAENLKKAQESLSVAIEHTGGDAAQLVPQYEATAKAASEFGITQTEAITELARATLITGDAAKAQAAYQEATVISAATGKDLNAVLIAAAKAQDGHTSALARYGVQVDKNSSTQEQLNAVMGKFQGQAEANTTASDKLRANLSNLQTNLGTALLPAFEKVTEAMNRAVLFVTEHWPEIQATILRTWTQIKPTFDALIDIVGVITDTIRDHWATISRNFDNLKTAVVDSLKVIRDAIALVDALLHGDWSAAWRDAKAVVSDAVGAILALLRNTVDNIKGAAMAIGKGIVDGISDGLSSLAGALKSALIDPINAVIGAIDALAIPIPSVSITHTHVPLLGDVPTGFDVGISGYAHPFNIPKLAAGGIVTGPTLALIGERGPEAVVPLPSGGGIGPTVNVYVTGWVGNDQDIAYKIRAELVKIGRREGNVLGGFA